VKLEKEKSKETSGDVLTLLNDLGSRIQ